MTPIKNAFSDTNKTDNPRKETTKLRALAIGFRLIMTAAPKPIITTAQVQNRKTTIRILGFLIPNWRLRCEGKGRWPIGNSKIICQQSSFLLVPLQHHSMHDTADL